MLLLLNSEFKGARERVMYIASNWNYSFLYIPWIFLWGYLRGERGKDHSSNFEFCSGFFDNKKYSGEIKLIQ